MSKNRKSASAPERRTVIDLPVRTQNLAVAVILFLALVLFFRSVVFEGQTFLPPDTIASHSFETLMKQASDEGIFPLWNPYIFCGMPGFASLTFSGARVYDFLTYSADLTRSALGYLFIDHDLGVYFIYYWVFGIGLYLFAAKKLQNRVAALISALGGTYAMYMIILVTAGHMTKIAVMAWFPFVFLLVDNFRERFRWWEGVLLVIVVRLMLVPSHIQYLFYLYLALALYFAFFLIRSFVIKEDWKPILRSGLVLTGATVMAFMMGADQYLSTLEYNPYSIRGMSPITATTDANSSKASGGGLDYDYATAWSLPPAELMTFVIPSWYGFGIVTYDGVLTQGRAVPLDLYWGHQRGFVEAPNYCGIIILVFALVGVVKNRHDPFVQYLTFTGFLAVLIAFGSEFPVVYNVFFNYVPFFNKFRVPSMSLMLLQFILPLLAGYGIVSLLHSSLTPVARRRWMYGFSAVGILLVFSLIGRGTFRGMFEGIFPPAEVLGGKYQPSVVGELYNFAFSMVANDLAVACTLLLLAFGAVYFFLQQKMKFTTLAVVLVVTTVVDLWRIDSRPLRPQPRSDKQQILSAPEYVRYLQQDSTQFRVLEFIDGQPPYNNLFAYWNIQSAYGYQGAKMRWYQDMLDVAGIGNPLVWQLMNVKYIITNRPDSTKFLGLAYRGPDRNVYFNRLAYPRAFFVSRYEVANGPDILKKIAMMSFDPRDVAFFVDDPKLSLDPALPNNSVEIKRYGLQDLSMIVTASGNNLLFLSEVYYPKGWIATLDGREIPIYRVNYLFRGVVVPPGTHSLEMHFRPTTYFTGKTVSLATNGGLVVLLCLSVITAARKRKKNLQQ